MFTFGFTVDKSGTSAAKFLSIGSGSRAIAMGSAFTSVAGDVSTMVWNPAGISRISGNAFFAEHSKHLADMYHNYIGLVVKNLSGNYNWKYNIFDDERAVDELIPKEVSIAGAIYLRNGLSLFLQEDIISIGDNLLNYRLRCGLEYSIPNGFKL